MNYYIIVLVIIENNSPLLILPYPRAIFFISKGWPNLEVICCKVMIDTNHELSHLGPVYMEVEDLK